MKKNSTSLILSAVVFVATFLMVSLAARGMSLGVIAAVSFVPVFFFLIFDFRLLISCLIISLFLTIQPFRLTTSVMFSLLVPIAFLVSYWKIERKDFKSPIIVPLFLFLATLIPSYILAENYLYSFYLSTNLLVFFLNVLIIPVCIGSADLIRKNIALYIGLCLVNGMVVIVEALLTGKRVFGPAGVMFVDYVGIAIVIHVIFLVTNAKKNKLWLYSSFFVLVLSSILTQTRNPWVVIIATILFFISYLLIKGPKIGINRIIIAKYLSIIVLVIFPTLFFIGEHYVPSIKSRSTELLDSEETVENKSLDSWTPDNSLVSRVLIWQTAINAFNANPVFGIGPYSFPVVSQKYNTLPNRIYRDWVKGLSPHHGYLMVLTETGIIGFLGFCCFLVGLVIFIFRSFRIAYGTEYFINSLVLGWSQIYIIISLMVTDAWLWGQGIVLWSIFLGLSIKNYRLTLIKSEHAHAEI